MLELNVLNNEQCVEQLFYVTILSNLARGYDKYSSRYSKAGVPESTFPDKFFLLRRDELQIGINKAGCLLKSNGLQGDRLLVVETSIASADLHPNERTGLGRFVLSNSVSVRALHYLDANQELIPVRIEEAFAASLQLLAPKLIPYANLKPRTVSFLPIASGCQAKCSFCFSKASVSADQENGSIPLERIRSVLDRGKQCGAERAVITGGGEPTLLKTPKLLELIGECSAALSKVVLISNGYIWGKATEEDRLAALRELSNAGLSVLALSRHHCDNQANARIMSLDTGSERVAATWSKNRANLGSLRLRFICVLQKGGIEDEQSLSRYLDWAAELGVEEICFKELYVSSSLESVYYSLGANEWSFRHQVAISLVTEFAARYGWRQVAKLPWGPPVYQCTWKGRPLQIAAYCEPSLFWERSNGLARSWNVMADGRCLVSLEDRGSEVSP
jgi:organic radical activating enzyme